MILSNMSSGGTWKSNTKYCREKRRKSQSEHRKCQGGGLLFLISLLSSVSASRGNFQSNRRNQYLTNCHFHSLQGSTVSLSAAPSSSAPNYTLNLHQNPLPSRDYYSTDEPAWQSQRKSSTNPSWQKFSSIMWVEENLHQSRRIQRKSFIFRCKCFTFGVGVLKVEMLPPHCSRGSWWTPS